VSDPRRDLPSVSALLDSAPVRALIEHTPRPVVVDAVRRVIDAARRNGSTSTGDDHWAAAVQAEVAHAQEASLRPVLNGTGVVLHTNLGRAPLAEVAIDAIARVASGFTNLEYDLDRGERGSRYTHCASILRELTGAGDALVVNNGAAALVLALNTVADDRDAIVSRGELVEIGGNFRIPDIMAKSGARLVEVGTTNRTTIDDYRRAMTAETGAIVKVHRSNFAIEGFVAEAASAELGALAEERNVSLLHDLGSGLLLPLDAFGLTGEPTARDAVTAAGRNGVVVMSGDKLLGGPQAGILLGGTALLERMRKNPLTRAYRVDKLTLAALEATLTLYRDPARALREIPVLAQLGEQRDSLRQRAAAICAAVGSTALEVIATESSVGGGAFPTARIPSAGIAVSGNANKIEATLRRGNPPLIARVTDGRVIIDLRTIFVRDDANVAAVLRSALA
jgi:L-seryl-tRNA(Ser) seleniumtransferase